MKDLKMHVNGIDLHVVDYGGVGETIICIHGLTANSRCWDAFAHQMISDYHVLAFDLRGRGDSQKPNEGYHIYQHAEDVLAILNFYKVKKAIVVGHSLGAAVGACFAANYPNYLSQLILVDGGVDTDPRIIEKIRPSIERLGTVFPDYKTYIAEMKKNPFYSNWNDYCEQFFYTDIDHHPNGTVCSKVSSYAVFEEIKALSMISIDEFYNRIHVPTLIAAAPNCFLDGQTFMVNKEQGTVLAAKLPNSRFTEIHGSNHYSILFNKYPQLAAEVKSFLKKTAEKAAG
ncbi:alpha/beta fold hydrolase [Bacillus taeanensis]|uniref:Alpha/beta hydrolase n=1 Tax=Bacillus taeanensis TaxID=273032 RepID=A0A366XWE6_9BACI|nr:alpha/beta hydrolase [Bacillus taeanensis]RBW70730.1 alpha/beta hydrolase [Bacillus taeanensis]